MVVAIRHTLFLVFSDLYRTSGPENNENKKHFSNNIGPKFSIHRQVSLSATPFPFLYVSSTKNAKRNNDIIILWQHIRNRKIKMFHVLYVGVFICSMMCYLKFLSFLIICASRIHILFSFLAISEWFCSRDSCIWLSFGSCNENPGISAKEFIVARFMEMVVDIVCILLWGIWDIYQAAVMWIGFALFPWIFDFLYV